MRFMYVSPPSSSTTDKSNDILLRLFHRSLIFLRHYSFHRALALSYDLDISVLSTTITNFIFVIGRQTKVVALLCWISKWPRFVSGSTYHSTSHTFRPGLFERSIAFVTIPHHLIGSNTSMNRTVVELSLLSDAMDSREANRPISLYWVLRRFLGFMERFGGPYCRGLCDGKGLGGVWNVFLWFTYCCFRCRDMNTQSFSMAKLSHRLSIQVWVPSNHDTKAIPSRMWTNSFCCRL